MSFSFYSFVSFLTIFHVLQCAFLIFLVRFFLAIFMVLQCAFLIFHVFQCFLPFSRSYRVYVSFSTLLNFLAKIQVSNPHISHFSLFLTIFQVLQCAFLIFHGFSCFSAYSRCYSVCFSFYSFVSFLAIFHVLQCAFLIFLVHSFLAILEVLQCAYPIFHVFQCVSPFSRS